MSIPSSANLAESWLHEFAAFVQGATLQNLGLMAIGLGKSGQGALIRKTQHVLFVQKTIILSRSPFPIGTA